jgi:hypothetical protein
MTHQCSKPADGLDKKKGFLMVGSAGNISSLDGALIMDMAVRAASGEVNGGIN